MPALKHHLTKEDTSLEGPKRSIPFGIIARRRGLRAGRQARGIGGLARDARQRDLFHFSGKNTSSAFFSVGLDTSEPTTMSTNATVMPIVIWCKPATFNPRAMQTQ